MRAKLSIVIPTLNGETGLVRALPALMEGVESGLVRELVISDGGSKDGTCRLADAAGARVVTGPASRGGQLARGVAASRGPWVMVMHADTVLAPGWSAAVAAHMTQHPGRAGYFGLRFDARGMAPGLVAGWANLRSRVFGLPYGDQGLVLSRALYDAVGGYPDQPLMEDVALARALAGRLQRLPGYAVTSPARYLRDGWVRRGARNLVTLLRYFLGARPETLDRGYRR